MSIKGCIKEFFLPFEVKELNTLQKDMVNGTTSYYVLKK